MNALISVSLICWQVDKSLGSSIIYTVIDRYDHYIYNEIYKSTNLASITKLMPIAISILSEEPRHLLPVTFLLPF